MERPLTSNLFGLRKVGEIPRFPFLLCPICHLGVCLSLPTTTGHPPKLNDNPARQEQTDAWIRFEIMSQSSQTEPDNLKLSENQVQQNQKKTGPFSNPRYWLICKHV